MVDPVGFIRLLHPRHLSQYEKRYFLNTIFFKNDYQAFLKLTICGGTVRLSPCDEAR